MSSEKSSTTHYTRFCIMTSNDALAQDPEAVVNIVRAALGNVKVVENRCEQIAAEREALESAVGDLKTEKQELERGARATKICTANWDESIVMSLLSTAQSGWTRDTATDQMLQSRS